ncbi:endonuclease VIII [Thiolapillus sp.]
MPEGPEIRRARDELAAAIEGKTAERVEFHLPALASWNDRFDGEKVLSVGSRGKAMLVCFANGYCIYSHNQLYGRWMVVKPGEWPDTRRQLRLAIHTSTGNALLFSASDIEVWPAEELSRHPFLRKLGPDVLDERLDVDRVCARLESARFYKRRLGSFLTDQAFVAGLGNYLRCEILFSAGLHPNRRPCELGAEQLAQLAGQILALPRQSYETGGITNEPARAQKLMASGKSFEQARFQVFRRAGEPCYRCGTTVVQEKQGGQPCYLCPNCQPVGG